MTTSTSSLEGKTVAITGAASGIGAACARAFAAAGAHPLLLDINEEAITASARELDGTAVAVDLASVASVEALDLRADVLINNAGFQHVSPIEEFSIDVFEKMLAVMVTSAFVLTRAVLPGMYANRWGRIITVSSVHGSRASAFKSGYVTAKHALEGLSKTIAVEGGPHGVTANCIDPAYVRTPLVENQIRDQARTHGIGEDEVVEKIMLARTATKRLIEPEEVAALALYLTQPQSSMINGASLRIDGGWTAQ